MPSSSKESHEFEVESYDFDIELDFKLMGLDEARAEEDDDPAPELEDLLKKFESKANVVADDFEIVNLGTPEIPREVRIGKSLPPEMKQKMIEFLAPRLSNFAFSYEDMPGLDEELVVHHLPTKADMKPVKQKLRRMKPEWALKVRDEVIKQYNAGFLVVSNYPEWLANIVPVPKKDGKVRMCIDFRDLNKASPKDDFPLPHIDTLVDNTAGYKIFSFMDGFSGYNQIKMAVEDREKTSFITPWGTFCYRVMPFGLKNAGATYQRAMTALFHDMMNKELEVYVDDMIVKSRTIEGHFEDLKKLFNRLEKYKLRLNPQKCVFGAMGGKLLGFMVSEDGIRVDETKTRAIIEMPPPRTEKEIRGFLGRIQYISRFIAQLTPICEPIFKLLRKNVPKEWNDDCQVASTASRNIS